MTAKVGYPTLRLIRNRIENISLNGMQPGGIKELSEEQIYKALFSKKLSPDALRNSKR
jgi:23S rRNA pseudouridine2457 synthase